MVIGIWIKKLNNIIILFIKIGKVFVVVFMFWVVVGIIIIFFELIRKRKKIVDYLNV